mmetsp:Transcript_25220/g.54823  ORF Transcript_25220/g.54823 Transcript_25220/m.54823 type:complete len:227 (+) Transcript_25220:399-1079(+)
MCIVSGAQRGGGAAAVPSIPLQKILEDPAVQRVIWLLLPLPLLQLQCPPVCTDLRCGCYKQFDIRLGAQHRPNITAIEHCALIPWCRVGGKVCRIAFQGLTHTRQHRDLGCCLCHLIPPQLLLLQVFCLQPQAQGHQGPLLVQWQALLQCLEGSGPVQQTRVQVCKVEPCSQGLREGALATGCRPVHCNHNPAPGLLHLRCAACPHADVMEGRVTRQRLGDPGQLS